MGFLNKIKSFFSKGSSSSSSSSGGLPSGGQSQVGGNFSSESGRGGTTTTVGSTIPSGRGSSSRSSGGGGLPSRGMSDPTSPTGASVDGVPIPINQVGVSSNRGQNVQQQQQIATATQQDISSTDSQVNLRRGGVFVGRTRFSGEAVVPGTDGLTANQVRRKFSDRFKEQTGQRVSPTRLSGTVEFEREVEQRQQSATNLLFGGDDLPQRGGMAFIGSEIGRTGAEAEQVFVIGERQEGRVEKFARQIGVSKVARQSFGLTPFSNPKMQRLSQGSAVSSSILLAVTPLNIGVGGQVSRLKFIGVEQKTISKGVQTDLVFQTTKGETGVARAITIKDLTIVKGKVGRIEGGMLTPRLKQTSEFIGRLISKSKPAIIRETRDIGQGIRVSKDIKSQVQLSKGQIAITKLPKFIRRVISPRGVETIKSPLTLRETIGTAISIGRKRLRIVGLSFGMGEGEINLATFTGRLKKLSPQQKQLFEITGKAEPKRIEFVSFKKSPLSKLTTRPISIKEIPRTTQPTLETSQIISKDALESALTITSQSVKTPPVSLKPIISPSKTTSLRDSQQANLKIPERQVVSQKDFQDLRFDVRQTQFQNQPTRSRSGIRQIQFTPARQKDRTIQNVIQRQPQKISIRQLQPSLLRQRQPSPRFAPSFIFKTSKKPPKFVGYPKLEPAKQVGPFGNYVSQVRRFGKFKSVGVGSFNDVFNLGKEKVERELGASFRIISPTGKVVNIPSIPKGFYKKQSKKFGTLLIEKRSRRIKKGSKELPELQYWKKVKSPLTKTKRRKK